MPGVTFDRSKGKSAPKSQRKYHSDTKDFPKIAKQYKPNSGTYQERQEGARRKRALAAAGSYEMLMDTLEKDSDVSPSDMIKIKKRAAKKAGKALTNYKRKGLDT